MFKIKLGVLIRKKKIIQAAGFPMAIVKKGKTLQPCKSECEQKQKNRMTLFAFLGCILPKTNFPDVYIPLSRGALSLDKSSTST